MGQYDVRVQFARVFQPFDPKIPGRLALDPSGLTFTARGGNRTGVALADVAAVMWQKNLLRADDVLIKTKSHGAWWVLVADGSALAAELDALRAA